MERGLRYPSCRPTTAFVAGLFADVRVAAYVHNSGYQGNALKQLGSKVEEYASQEVKASGVEFPTVVLMWNRSQSGVEFVSLVTFRGDMVQLLW